MPKQSLAGLFGSGLIEKVTAKQTRLSFPIQFRLGRLSHVRPSNAERFEVESETVSHSPLFQSLLKRWAPTAWQRMDFLHPHQLPRKQLRLRRRLPGQLQWQRQACLLWRLLAVGQLVAVRLENQDHLHRHRDRQRRPMLLRLLLEFLFQLLASQVLMQKDRHQQQPEQPLQRLLSSRRLFSLALGPGQRSKIHAVRVRVQDQRLPSSL